MTRESNSVTFGPFTGELEDAFCPACGAGALSSNEYLCDKGIGYFRCAGCGILYASPRFTEESMLRIYETQEFADLEPYLNWSYDAWRIRGDRTYITSAQKVALVKRYLPRGSRLLDVGCATGLFVMEANEQGFVCEGLEPSRMLSTIARNVLKVPVSTAQIEDFRTELTFNGIILWDVLEHLYDPVRVLHSCANLIAPDGLIFLQVPHSDGMSFRLKSMLSRRGLKKPGYKHFGFPWHVYAFNRESLSRMLLRCGLEAMHFESWSHLLKDGKQSFPKNLIIRAARMFCLSDYIICVARKRQEYENF